MSSSALAAEVSRRSHRASSLAAAGGLRIAVGFHGAPLAGFQAGLRRRSPRLAPLDMAAILPPACLVQN
jgi:hypothetical protein